MTASLNHKERQSAREIKLLIGDILQLLAEHFGGETTINQMKIGHYIGFKSLYLREATSNKDISETLGIPRSTVSRIVSDYLVKRWVEEQSDPSDGRKKMLIIPPDHPHADRFEIEFRKRINGLLRRYEADHVIIFDSEKEGF